MKQVLYEYLIIDRYGNKKRFNMSKNYKSRLCKRCKRGYCDNKKYWEEVHRHNGYCQECSSRLK